MKINFKNMLNMKKEQLLQYCQENNIKVFKSWNKSKIVETIEQSENEIQENKKDSSLSINQKVTKIDGYTTQGMYLNNYNTFVTKVFLNDEQNEIYYNNYLFEKPCFSYKLDELKVLANEYNINICQGNLLNSSYIEILAIELYRKIQNLKANTSSDENKEVENLKEKYIIFAQSLDVKTYQKYRRIALLDDYLVDCFNLHYSRDIIDFIEFMHNEVVENGKLINFPYDFKSSNISSKLIGGLYLPTIINFEKSYDDNFYTFSFFVNENLTNQVFICGDNENGNMKITTNFNQFGNLDIKTIEKYIQDKFNKFKDENLQQLESKNNNIIDNKDKKEITIKTSNLTMVAKYHDRYSKILDKTYRNEVYEYCLMNSKNEIIYQSGNNLSILIYEEEDYISIKSYIDEVVYALENNLVSLIENFMYLNGVGSTIHAIRKHKNIV